MSELSDAIDVFLAAAPSRRYERLFDYIFAENKNPFYLATSSVKDSCSPKDLVNKTSKEFGCYFKEERINTEISVFFTDRKKYTKSLRSIKCIKIIEEVRSNGKRCYTVEYVEDYM